MLLTPVAVSLFAFIALIVGTVLFHTLERRLETVERRIDPLA